MVRTIKKHRVRSVSCQWASHLQRIFFIQGFGKHSAQCHNQSASTTSFTALSQPKSTCCTACCLLLEHSHAFVCRACERGTASERGTFSTASESVRASPRDSVCRSRMHPGALRASQNASAIAVCRNERGGPQGGDEWRKRNSFTDENLTHTSHSASPSRVRSETDQADRWSCVSAVAAGMALTGGLQT